MNVPVLRILSRASPLAQRQVDEALAALGAAAVLPPVIRQTAQTWGDRHLEVSLLDGSAPPDLFTRDLDDALRAGQADCAIHSAKDLPIPLPPDLVVAALLPPADQSDSLVCRAGLGPTLANLPTGARVATSSPSRRSQLAALRPDLVLEGIRGTIESRLAQVDQGRFDAVIVATCALDRLGLGHRIGERLPFTTHPLQGRLAVTALRRRFDVRATWTRVDERRGWGSVSLVGAGPGDPKLLTLRAKELLEDCDLVLTDSLANPALLDGLRAAVRFVGKRGDAGGEAQAAIHEALWDAVRAGQRVVRLKGGDPMIFGRGSEELDYLQMRLVDVEVVPGISSAQALSAYTGIPLTERALTANVAYCLGAPADRITVPDADVLVYYMASATLGDICARVSAAGRSDATPVALVRNASLPDQQVWLHTLGALRAELEAGPHPYASPLLAVFGPVVTPDRATSWFDALPRVWYTGLRTDHRLPAGRVTHRPLVRVEPVVSADLDDALTALDAYAWAVFPSRTAVAAVAAAQSRLGRDARSWAGVKIAALGQGTAADLAALGLRADVVPAVETAEGLLAEWPVRPGDRVFVPCGDSARPTLIDGLSARGATSDRVTVYRTVTADLDPAWSLDAFDEVVLTSPSGVDAFRGRFAEPPEALVLTAWGPVTAAALRAAYPGRPVQEVHP